MPTNQNKVQESSNPISAQDTPAKFSMDIHDMYADADGVKGFFWPVSYAERHVFGEALATAYTNLVKKYDTEAGAMIPYKIIAKFFFSEAMTVFTGDLLRERFECEVTFPQRIKRWKALFNKQSPPKLHFLETLRRNPVKPELSKLITLSRIKRLFKIFNIGKKGIDVDGFKLKPITTKVLQNDIIATKRFPLMLIRAERKGSEGKDLVFCRSDRWFKTVTNDDLKTSKQENHTQFINEVFDVLSECYHDNGIVLEKHSRQYLLDLLEEGAAAIRVHYNRLLASPEALPKHIWTGTTGDTWDTALRMAAMHHGGTAIGFDHGVGCGHVDYIYSGIDELWGCHEFVTFNDANASEVRKMADSWLYYDKKLPKVTGASSGKQPAEIEISEHHKKLKTPKTVMIMVEPFDGDMGRLTFCSHDIVHLDWQCRVIHKLKEWGYDVIAKVHPDSFVMPPSFYEEKFGIRVTSTPFEQVMHDADVVIFDYVFTTTVKSIAATNIPFAIVDFYGHNISETAMGMLEKRCSYVEAGFDEQNRRSVNWDKLKAAIESAPEKNTNHEFYNYFYA